MKRKLSIVERMERIIEEVGEMRKECFKVEGKWNMLKELLEIRRSIVKFEYENNVEVK